MPDSVKADTALPQTDYTQRRGELSAFGRAVNAKHAVQWWLAALIGLVFFIVVVSLALPALLPLRIALIAVACVVLFGGIVVWRLVSEHLIKPELATRKWIQKICDGELSSTIELPESHPHFKELDFHTRNVGTSLRRLSDEMDSLCLLYTSPSPRDS